VPARLAASLALPRHIPNVFHNHFVRLFSQLYCYRRSSL
jgi:hypothetical protein